MSAIRAKGNRDTEGVLASILREKGITGWRKHIRLVGNPDFVFRAERLAVFVDGCFWHGCPAHGRNPSSNRSYWLPKLRRNRQRDLEATRELRRLGWRVLRVWEHDLRKADLVAARIHRFLRRPPRSGLIKSQ